MNKIIFKILLLILLVILAIAPIYAGFSYYVAAKPKISANNSFTSDGFYYYPEEFPLDTPDGVLNKKVVDSFLKGPNGNDGLLNEGSKLNSLFTYKMSKKLDYMLTSEDIILVDGSYMTVRDYLNQDSSMYFVLVRETGNWFNQDYSLYTTNNLKVSGGYIKPVYKTHLKWYYNAGNSYYEIVDSKSGRAKSQKIKARNEENDFKEERRKINFFNYESWEYTGE